MTDLVIALVTVLVHLSVSFGFARHAYRHEYKLIYGSPAPYVYGGKHGHDRAHEVAIKEACQWLVMWPFFCTWAGMGWLISHGSTQDWVERDNKISQAQWEVDQLAAQQDPLRELEKCRHGQPSIDQCATCSAVPWPEPCPCGYTDECVIHCGDGSRCHEGTALDRQRRYGSPVSVGTEIIRTHHPEAIRERTMDGKIVIDIPGCSCSKCQPDQYPEIGVRYER